MPDNEKKFKAHIAKINFLWRTIEYGGYTKDAPHKLKGKIFRVLTGGLYKVTDVKKLFARYEKLCAKYNGTDNHRVSYVAHSRGKEKHLFRKEWFDESVMLPFEFTMIPAPVGYDARLRLEYNDYMTPRNVAPAHGGAILDPDLPYGEFIRRRKEKRAAARAKKRAEREKK